MRGSCSQGGVEIEGWVGHGVGQGWGVGDKERGVRWVGYELGVDRKSLKRSNSAVNSFRRTKPPLASVQRQKAQDFEVQVVKRSNVSSETIFCDYDVAGESRVCLKLVVKLLDSNQFFASTSTDQLRSLILIRGFFADCYFIISPQLVVFQDCTAWRLDVSPTRSFTATNYAIRYMSTYYENVPKAVPRLRSFSYCGNYDGQIGGASA